MDLLSISAEPILKKTWKSPLQPEFSYRLHGSELEEFLPTAALGLMRYAVHSNWNARQPSEDPHRRTSTAW
jgi:hypothetical protein